MGSSTKALSWNVMGLNTIIKRGNVKWVLQSDIAIVQE